LAGPPAGRILELLAEGAVLTGALDGLIRNFELAPDDLWRCLRELIRATRVAIQFQSVNRLTVRIERRSYRAPLPSI
jgi:hypothetical protein